MTWIDIAWPMMGAVSLTLASIHLLIWFHQRTEWAHLMFSLAAGSVAVLAIFELLAVRAQTPEQYATVLRWAHVPVALLVISLVGFVLLRFPTRRPWLGFAACGLRLGALVANFLSGVNLNFETITALERIEVWGPDVIAGPIGDPNPWMLPAQLGNLLLLLFMLDAIVSTWRRGDASERRRALLVCGSIALFVVLSSAWTMLIVLDQVNGPLTVNIAFFFVVLAMSHELSGDVVRASRIARQLADSESSLRESKQRMQHAAHAAGLGLWTWDIDGDTLWFTETGRALLDLAQGEQISGDDLMAQVHPDDRQAIVESRRDAIRSTGEYACDFRLQQKDGHIRWISAKGRVEYAPSGLAVRVRGVIFDITERRQAEDRFQLVIEGVPNAMLIVDGQRCITFANEQAARLFGYTRIGLHGQQIDALVPHGPLAGHAADQIDHAANAPAGSAGVGPLYGRRKDDSTVQIEVWQTPIEIEGDLFTLVSLTDISQRVRLEQETALQRDELAHLSRVTLLGEMSGSLAHELNQPLTAVLSNAQAAMRFLQQDPPDLDEVHDCLVHIVENDKRASEVIRHLRTMLRKGQVDYQVLDINEVVRDVLRLMHSDILNRDVAIVLDFGLDLPMVNGDRVQLQQVLLNLIFNGCDSMEELRAGRTLTIRTRALPGPAIEVSISDVGRGIPADDLERIFTPYVTSKEEGIGLGLAICRTIIQAHRGRLWATTHAPRGATLHFTLPA